MVFIFISATLLCVSAGFFYIGFSGILKKQAVIINSRILSGLVIMCFLPSVVNSLTILSSVSIVQSSISIFGFVLLVFILSKSLQGFIILGVTDESFQSALKRALEKLNLKYTVGISAIEIEGHGQLVAQVQPWVGTAMIRGKGDGMKKIMPQVSQEIKKELSQKGLPMNYFSLWMYSVLGFFLLVLCLLLLNSTL